MGILNLMLIKSEDSIDYYGAIQFHKDDRFKRLSCRPFPLRVEFNAYTGELRFHIIGAAKIFDSGEPLSLGFHFEFSGTYIGGDTISGDGGVPLGFCPSLGPAVKSRIGPEDEGETVTWTSAGLPDPDSKSSE
jgi:hypothetical protein